MAGTLVTPLPEGLEVIRVPCAGRIDALHMMRAFENGADGVMIFSCHKENCQSLRGNRMAQSRTGYVLGVMEGIGLEKERLEVCHLATNDGAKYAEAVKRKYEDLCRMGPNPMK
jgi:coenzyme F420-reducing hydrogenase delta subunit